MCYRCGSCVLVTLMKAQYPAWIGLQERPGILLTRLNTVLADTPAYVPSVAVSWQKRGYDGSWCFGGSMIQSKETWKSEHNICENSLSIGKVKLEIFLFSRRVNIVSRYEWSVILETYTCKLVNRSLKVFRGSIMIINLQNWV